jgi:tRNA (mo5U34)-methyltransferase
MLKTEALYRDLDEIGLTAWRDTLAPILSERMANRAHGDLEKWKEILAELPGANGPWAPADEDAVLIRQEAIPCDESGQIRRLLQGLIPWRKGPFSIHDISLDSEWRSDLKWNRIRSSIAPLQDRNVLDVGCGNGYYAFRMRLAGAARVIGIDPTILFVCQFLALKKLSGATGIHVLPLRSHDLPAQARSFDTTFSMGVLYHQRDPARHLSELYDTLRPGGELVLETLVMPGDSRVVFEPQDRYARMRNVWHLPSIPALESWLKDAGLTNIQLVDVSATTVDEQRSTPWMPFESLAESLDPSDSSLTIEGLPAPTRAVLTGTAS